MIQQETDGAPGAGAFGVNYALRPHKFVDRRIFIEIINRYANYHSIQDHACVGLGSFAMEDHKYINASFDIQNLISLEIDPDVFERQKFNLPLACIKPTNYSTSDFIERKRTIFQEMEINENSNSVVWFDMTDSDSLRAHLDTFGRLLEISQPGDVIRMTVDIDEKTLGRRAEDENLDTLQTRRFGVLRDQLGEDMNPKARVRDLTIKLGIANLAAYAFRLVAEKAFQRNNDFQFLPLSITTYADGHRMLSVTGAIVRRDHVDACRDKMNLRSVPGGTETWDKITDIQIPQLTVWEKLSIDRNHGKRPKQSTALNFKLHETISTKDLLEGYHTFQRFYPTFRHVLL